MSRDLAELLHHTAPQPTQPLDASALIGRARRQRRRSGVILSAVLACAVALGTVSVITTEAPDVAFAPNDPAGPGTSATQPVPLPPAPIDARSDAIAVWTGDEVLVWGGQLVAEMGAHPDQVVTGSSGGAGESVPIGEVHFSDGAAYDPQAGRWRTIADAPLAGGYGDQAVWTGDVMLVWSYRERQLVAYDPSSDAWADLAPPPLRGRGVPVVSLVWTGREAIVWGGMDHEPGVPAFGASYDVGRDVWTALPEAPVPARQWHTAVWTGHDMIVWGGTTLEDAVHAEHGGASYAPLARQWQALPLAPGGGRYWHSAVWTGKEMLVWGGSGTAGGIAFDPVADTWREVPEAPLEPRHWATMVWTGSQALVWGGYGQNRAYGDGAAYDPGTNSWALLSPSGLSGRCKHAAAWTGSALFVWSGVPGCDIDPPASDGALLTVSPAITPPASDAGAVHAGTLPDGTPFIVKGTSSSEKVTGVHAVIEADTTDGHLPAGVLTFDHAPDDGERMPRWKGRVLHLRAGEWSVRFDAYPGVLRRVGLTGKDIVAGSIVATSRDGMPILRLDPPLRFASDEDVPSSMEVQYETFAVRRGCAATPSAVCAEDGCVHIVPLTDLVAPAPAERNDGWTISAECGSR